MGYPQIDNIFTVVNKKLSIFNKFVENNKNKAIRLAYL